MELLKVGRVGRPHGLKGELKLIVEDHFEEDLLKAAAVLVGEPPIPFFLEYARGGGALIVKLEGFDQREEVAMLSNKDIYLPADQVRGEPAEVQHPFLQLVGYTIKAEGYPDLGPIEEVMDLPQHYLAQLTHEGNEVLIPLHEDLILERRDEERLLLMQLPEGLLG